jgi:integrase
MELTGTLSHQTIHNRKRGLTPLWNYAADRGWSKGYEARRLRRIKVADPIVVPWTTSQLRQLLVAVETLPGTLKIGIPARDLMRALLWLSFETGLRPSDWLRVRFDQFDLDNGLVRIVQHKTGKAHVANIGVCTIEAIRKIQLPLRAEVIPLLKSGVRKWELQLFAHAEKTTGFKRRKGQALGTLRKTHGTEVCREHGIEAAAHSLGHVSGTRVARRHYVQADVWMTPIPAPKLSEETNGHASQSGAATMCSPR